ncbi:unnamed protein product [Caenorhabditis sp. 36 PRJEB53466]|nr:unnamed protein product [Caenorhabditis sp. 36 PRJEB53466]
MEFSEKAQRSPPTNYYCFSAILTENVAGNCSTKLAGYSGGHCRRGHHFNRHKKVSPSCGEQTKPAELIEACYARGQRHFGENYVQELEEKSASLAEKCPEIRWHFIGQVQSNKIAKICNSPGLWCVETVETEKHAQLFNKEWSKRGSSLLQVFVQVNTSNEENKGGIAVDEAPKLAEFIREKCENLKFAGFMTIGSFGHSHTTGPNPDFDRLFQAREQWAELAGEPSESVELSMGMSDDFVQAIQQGSTSMEEFRANILKEVRDLMQKEKQYEEASKMWNGNETKGFELPFAGTKNGVPVNSGVVGQVLISRDGGFEAIITTYVVKNDLRSIVSSFSVLPTSSLPLALSAGLSSLLVSVTSTLTLNHILMLSELRDRIVAPLKTSDVARLSQASKCIRSTVTTGDVDRTFWKKHLRKEFGAEKVQETVAKGRTFHGVYCETKKANIRIAQDRAAHHNPLLIGVYDPLRADPLRVPDRGPLRPAFNPPDPDAGIYIPFGPDPPFMGGLRQPRGPDFPDMFAGQNHPDLNPTGMWPRGGPGSNQGRPFMRGPPGGGGFGGGFI